MQPTPCSCLPVVHEYKKTHAPYWTHFANPRTPPRNMVEGLPVVLIFSALQMEADATENQLMQRLQAILSGAGMLSRRAMTP